MRKIFLILLVLILNIVNGQQEYPLNRGIRDFSEGAYLKDTKGELNQYVGIWKGTRGKNIDIRFKENKV